MVDSEAADSAASSEAPDPVVGKVTLFTPNNPNKPTVADFEAAIRGTATAAALGELVPKGTANSYEKGARTPEGGFKFQWSDGTSDWLLRGHGPDSGAPPGTMAKSQWTFRVEYRAIGGSRGSTRFLTSRDVATGQGGTGPPTRWLGGAKAEVTHIPLFPHPSSPSKPL